MRMKTSKTIPAIILALLLLPALSLAEQYKITTVYDGATIRAEGYDKQARG